MHRPSRIGGDGSRTPFVVAPILAGMISALLLAREAYQAAAEHRRTAEHVLRDYAALAAAEMVRRSANELGYYGYYPLVTALGNAARGGRGLPADILDALPRGDEGLQRAAPLLQSAMTWDAQAGLAVEGRPLAPDVAAWLSAHLPPGGATRGFSVLQGMIGGAPHTFVIGPVQGRRILVGFEVALPRITDWLERAFEQAPLLPPSLGRGAVTNASLSLVVHDLGGVERFRSQPNEWPLSEEVPFGDAYQSVLSGSTVRASIDPQAAGRLVIGGLPGSRLPALAGLLALTGGLLLTALLQLRRERALHRLRTDFVASVSHELRTPLTQIRMFAETLLLDRVRSAEERLRAVEIIDKEARRLSHLVENILQFSRSERGAVAIAVEERELGVLVAEIVQDFRPLLSGTGMRLETSLAEGLWAAVDADAVRQILLNLLDNSAKYGPRGQLLRVGLEPAGAWARIAVDDQGPGIPPDDRDRVFERFHRLDRDVHRAVAGAGIGLSVVRDLARRHGGRCSVGAGPEGGARFVLELPLLPERTPSPPEGGP